MTVAALILAGGRGTRFGGDLPKQFLPLADRPLLSYSLDAFEHSPDISDIVLVVPRDLERPLSEMIDLEPYRKIHAIVPGGALRQDSVMNGLSSVPGRTDLVMIHDGARPFPPMDRVSRALEAARECGAAILALAVSDTVKKTDPDGTIVATLEREALWLAQTPQIFRKELIWEAYKILTGKGESVTDDAGAVEQMGVSVRIVQGAPSNIKITTSWDLTLAKRFLNGTEEVFP